MPFKKGHKHGVRFGSGQPINKKGRPRKLLTTLKNQGYKESQVMQTLNTLFALGIDELQKIESGEEYTALERTIAAAIVSGLEKRDQTNIMQILERTLGKPKQSMDHNLQGKVKVTFKLGGNR
jgi:hypothetical protein